MTIYTITWILLSVCTASFVKCLVLHLTSDESDCNVKSDFLLNAICRKIDKNYRSALQLIQSNFVDANRFNESLAILASASYNQIRNIKVYSKELNIPVVGAPKFDFISHHHEEEMYVEIGVKPDWYVSQVLGLMRLATNWTWGEACIILDQSCANREIWRNLNKRITFEYVGIIPRWEDTSGSYQHYRKTAKVLSKLKSSVFLLCTQQFETASWFQLVSQHSPSKMSKPWIILDSLSNVMENFPQKTFIVKTEPIGGRNKLLPKIINQIEKHSRTLQGDEFMWQIKRTIRNELTLSDYRDFGVNVYYVKNRSLNNQHWREATICAKISKFTQSLDLCETESLSMSHLPVVIIPTAPIVMIDYLSKPTISSSGHFDCLTRLPCITGTLDKTVDIRQTYLYMLKNDITEMSSTVGGQDIELHCCSGIFIDILKQLMRDIDFKVILYSAPDGRFGEFVNGSWNGIVGELEGTRALMGLGALMITKSRSEVLGFIPIYVSNSYKMIVRDKLRNSNINSPFEPFLPEVWIFIFGLALLSGFAMAILEWNSPFGLNPWGRRRSRNFTLCSGIVNVLSLLFGHNINTKTPKSWPVKVVQNFWAAACICVVASYTANLISFVMGTVEKTTFEKIKQSVNPTIGTLEYAIGAHNFLLRESSSAVKHINVGSTEEGLRSVENTNISGYLDDNIIVEYTIKKYWTECNVRLESLLSTNAGYGLAFPNVSWLKDRIHLYHSNGIIEDIYNSYMQTTRQCKKIVKQISYSNIAGIFLCLACGAVISVLVLGFEWYLFRNLIPWWRSKPSDHFMKNTHVMFISQRVHRAIHTEMVEHNHRERMMEIIRKRDFTQMFLKHNKNPTFRENTSPYRPGRLHMYNLCDGLETLHKTQKNSLRRKRSLKYRSQNVISTELILQNNNNLDISTPNSNSLGAASVTSQSESSETHDLQQHDNNSSHWLSNQSREDYMIKENRDKLSTSPNQDQLFTLWRASELSLHMKVEALRQERENITRLIQDHLSLVRETAVSGPLEDDSSVTLCTKL